MWLKKFLVLSFLIILASARKHHLEIENDVRPVIKLGSFGYQDGGHLKFKLSQLKFPHWLEYKTYVLSLIKTDSINELYSNKCPYQEDYVVSEEPSLFFIVDFARSARDTLNKHVKVKSSKNWQNEEIYNTNGDKAKISVHEYSPSVIMLELDQSVGREEMFSFFQFSFVVLFNKREDEGLYHIYFQACEDPSFEKAYPTSFNVDFEESNYQNFLSTTEMRLPAIFLMMSLCFGLAGILWAQIIQKRKRNASQAHYFMAVLIFVKSFALFVLAFNLKYIGNNGSSYWLLINIYNALHLAKVQLFHFTILIIYKKFSFIKNTFKIVLLLQFMATLAEIISLTTEQGSLDYSTLRDIFILADFLSCVLILLPTLSFGEKLPEENENSTFVTKLKIYRRFYIVFACYVFSSRIIGFMLNLTSPHQFLWTSKFFIEMSTFVLYLFAGYTFQPLNEASGYSTVRAEVSA